MHTTAGAVAIGARPFLVAFNVYLGPASNLAVAKQVAKAVRGSSGGLRYVKALGLEVDGQAQVSMNLVDTERTPLHRAYEAVRTEAQAHGVTPTWSEIVGLVPERVLLDAGIRHVQLRGIQPRTIAGAPDPRRARRRGPSLSDFVPQPSPRRRRRPAAEAWPPTVGALAAALRRNGRRADRRPAPSSRLPMPTMRELSARRSRHWPRR